MECDKKNNPQPEKSLSGWRRVFRLPISDRCWQINSTRRESYSNEVCFGTGRLSGKQVDCFGFRRPQPEIKKPFIKTGVTFPNKQDVSTACVQQQRKRKAGVFYTYPAQSPIVKMGRDKSLKIIIKIVYKTLTNRRLSRLKYRSYDIFLAFPGVYDRVSPIFSTEYKCISFRGDTLCFPNAAF